MTTFKEAAEWQRLSAANSVGALVAQIVAGFTLATVEEALGSECAALTVPTGWLVAASGDTVQQPVRAVVTGHRSRGGWQGCDTVAAFRFTGMPHRDVGNAHVSDTLCELRASGITTRRLDVPPVPAVWAVRSSGYVTAAGLRMWAQFSTYVEGSHDHGNGRLLEHSLFVTTQRRTQLRADLIELSDTVHAAFCASVTANY
jgi:hypothetical protein